MTNTSYSLFEREVLFCLYSILSTISENKDKDLSEEYLKFAEIYKLGISSLYCSFAGFNLDDISEEDYNIAEHYIYSTFKDKFSYEDKHKKIQIYGILQEQPAFERGFDSLLNFLLKFNDNEAIRKNVIFDGNNLTNYDTIKDNFYKSNNS